MHVEYCQDIYGISAIVDNSEQKLKDCHILLPSVLLFANSWMFAAWIAHGLVSSCPQ